MDIQSWTAARAAPNLDSAQVTDCNGKLQSAVQLGHLWPPTSIESMEHYIYIYMLQCNMLSIPFLNKLDKLDKLDSGLGNQQVTVLSSLPACRPPWWIPRRNGI